MKLTKQDKFEIIQQRQSGATYDFLSLKYRITKSNIYYLCSLYKKHGDSVINSNYHHYDEPFKIQAVKRVKNGETLFQTSIELGLSNSGTLSRWIMEFDNNCGRIPKRKRGRLPMKKNKFKANLNKNTSSVKSSEDQIKELKQQIKENNEKLLYQEAEIEYLKKLKALMLAKKHQQKTK